MRRTPLILWRAILGELWRLILMTASILVIVLAFAAGVRFLADGRMGPVDTLRWMFLSMPPMLQYALPFAAGFGATLAYHRVCTDNELNAAFAAGVSHRSLLFPAILSGIILSLTILVLSNVVIPRFLRLAEQLITRDAARLIVASIERKQAVKMGDTLLYADLVRRSPDTGDGSYERLYLQRLFAVEFDKKGKVKYQVSAREADVWLIRTAADAPTTASADAANAPADAGADDSTDTVTHVVIRSRGTVGQKAGEGAMEGETMNLARTIPNAFTDDPKFLSWSELRDLRKEPASINGIDAERRVLAARLAERQTTAAISRSLAETGMVRFEDDAGAGVTVHGSTIRWVPPPEQHWVIEPGVQSPTPASSGSAAPASPGDVPGSPSSSSPPLLVERRYETGRTTHQYARSVIFRTNVDPASPEREVTITLTLSGLAGLSSGNRGTDAAGGAGELKPQTVAQLIVPNVDVAGVMSAGTYELLDDADELLAARPEDDYVLAARTKLHGRVSDLMREVTSKQHERFATAAACLVMVLTGAVMAIHLRSKLPLEVYLWAFFPALATVITISAGQQMIHRNGFIGIPVMWAGVVGLGVYTYIQFRRVARH